MYIDKRGVTALSVSRIKTIAITALVLVNAFFLAIIIRDTYTGMRDERQAIENVCVILRSNGIEINPDSIKTAGAIRAMRVARGVEMEATIASALLGQADITDQGAIFLYENTERGTAKFSSGGDFEIQLYDGVITDADGILKIARDILRSMRLDASVSNVSRAPESETVTAVNTYKDSSIVNCTIDFVFSGGSLRTVSGKYVTGVEPMENSASISHTGTALLRLLAAQKAGDVEFANITDVEAGYYYSVFGTSGEGFIDPVWLITTDAGRYVIDSATGEIRLA